jgi:hypothetical protein
MKKCKIKKMELGGFSMQKPTLEYSKGYGVGTSAATGALGGAGTGAAIGSVIPVVGTAIGAIGGGLIGGLSGLFGGLSKRKAGRDAELSQYQSEMRDYNLAKQSYADNLRNQDSMQLRDEKTSGYDIQSMYRFGGVLPKFLNGGKIPQYQAGGNMPGGDTTAVSLGRQFSPLEIAGLAGLSIGSGIGLYYTGKYVGKKIANSDIAKRTIDNLYKRYGSGATNTETGASANTASKTATKPILQIGDGNRTVLGKQEGVKPTGDYKTDLNSRIFYNTGNTPKQLEGSGGSANIVRVSSKNPKFRILPPYIESSEQTFYQPPASEIRTIHLDPATGEIMKTKNALTSTGKLGEIKQSLRRFGLKGIGGLGSVLPAMSIGLDIANIAKQTPQERKAQEYETQSKLNQGWDYSNLLTGISPEQVLIEELKDKMKKKQQSEDYKKAQTTRGTTEYQRKQRQSYK